ncbi:hypothetical protein AWENTII_002320 [Aspergillus wentii]
MPETRSAVQSSSAAPTASSANATYLSSFGIGPDSFPLAKVAAQSSRIASLPFKRSLNFRFDDEGKRRICKITSQSCNTAAWVQTRGVEHQYACASYADGDGPFATCVTLTLNDREVFRGAGANCSFHSRGSRCTFYGSRAGSANLDDSIFSRTAETDSAPSAQPSLPGPSSSQSLVPEPAVSGPAVPGASASQPALPSASASGTAAPKTSASMPEVPKPLPALPKPLQNERLPPPIVPTKRPFESHSTPPPSNKRPSFLTSATSFQDAVRTAPKPLSRSPGLMESLKHNRLEQLDGCNTKEMLKHVQDGTFADHAVLQQHLVDVSPMGQYAIALKALL